MEQHTQTLLMIAPCSMKKNKIGGAVTKNKSIYLYYNQKYNVSLIDTYWEKKNILQYFFVRYVKKIYWLLKIAIISRKTDAVILGSNNDNYIRLLHHLKLLDKTSLFAIGGIVPERVKDSDLPLNVWSQFKNIYVESPQMAAELHQMGLTNSEFLPNFKKLPYYTAPFKVSDTNEYLSIFYHGRICRDKGIDCLIEGVDELAKEGLHVRLDLFGELEEGYDIPMSDEHIKYCGKLNLVGSFKDYEILRREELYAFPTKWKGEGLSSSVQDVLAVGKPIIATRHNLNDMMVKDGYNGFLFEIDNVNELKGLIKKFYYHRDLIYEMGKNSLKMADQFRIENVLSSVNLFD